MNPDTGNAQVVWRIKITQPVTGHRYVCGDAVNPLEDSAQNVVGNNTLNFIITHNGGSACAVTPRKQSCR